MRKWKALWAGLLLGMSSMPAQGQEQPERFSFNTAIVDIPKGGSAKMMFQTFGVSLDQEIVGSKSFPAIGAERIIQGYDTVLYRETAIHRLFRASLSDTVKAGKRKSSKVFDTATRFDLMDINSNAAICQFDKPRKRAPYFPAATCLVDNTADGAFNEILLRRSGDTEFRSGGSIDPVTYEKSAYIAEMFFQDGKSPLPGVMSKVIGWDEKGARIIGLWLGPSESFGDTLKRPRDQRGPIAQTGNNNVYDQVFLFPAGGKMVDPLGMRFTILDPQWKTLNYRIDQGYGIFPRENAN